LTVLLALVLAVAIVVSPDRVPVGGAASGIAPWPTGARVAATVPVSAGGAVAIERAQAVREVLAVRAAALASGGAAQWTGTVDPAAGEFAARQGVLFDTLTHLPMASWSYTYAGTGPALPPSRARQLGPEAFIARVRLRYRLAEVDEREVQRDQFLTFARRRGGWLIAGDDDAGRVGRSAQPEPWDLGEVAWAQGRSSLVLSRPGPARRAASEITGLADRAVADVERVWPRPWPRRIVVVMPADVTEMARLLHAGAETEPLAADPLVGLARIAAVTTGQPTGEPGGTTTGNRIMVNPTAFAGLTAAGRQVVLTHEATHVATRSVPGRPVPSWLSEGLADYIAYRGTDLSPAEIAGDALRQVRAGAAPIRLPTEADFDASRAPVSVSYSLAWLAARQIAQTYGQDALVAFYLTSRTDPAGTTAAFEQVLGTTEAAFLARWQQAVTDLAGATTQSALEPVPVPVP
jgi:hypothetical protein